MNIKKAKKKAKKAQKKLTKKLEKKLALELSTRRRSWAPLPTEVYRDEEVPAKTKTKSVYMLCPKCQAVKEFTVTVTSRMNQGKEINADVSLVAECPCSSSAMNYEYTDMYQCDHEIIPACQVVNRFGIPTLASCDHYHDGEFNHEYPDENMGPYIIVAELSKPEREALLSIIETVRRDHQVLPCTNPYYLAAEDLQLTRGPHGKRVPATQIFCVNDDMVKSMVNVEQYKDACTYLKRYLTKWVELMEFKRIKHQYRKITMDNSTCPSYWPVGHRRI